MIQVGFSLQVVKTPIYLVICPFSLFDTLCDHNPPTLPKDEWTDRRHAFIVISWIKNLQLWVEKWAPDSVFYPIGLKIIKGPFPLHAHLHIVCMLALLEHIEATKKTPENRSVKQVSETLSKVTGYSSSPQASPLRELTCMLHVCFKFGVDSSSWFPFTARTCTRVTDFTDDLPPAWVINTILQKSLLIASCCRYEKASTLSFNGIEIPCLLHFPVWKSFNVQSISRVPNQRWITLEGGISVF